MAFAQGTIPLRIEGAGARFGAAVEEAVRAIDGDPTPYTFVSHAPGDTATEIVYELPATTTFARFSVPNVTETPSAFQTFVRTVEVFGSSTSADAGFTLLASSTLETHAKKGLSTELTMTGRKAVRWVKLRLAGGIRVEKAQTNVQFSELVGTGEQESVPRVDRFRGVWTSRGMPIELAQDGALVTGCYDDGGELSGTVSGNLLRARGVNAGTKVVSLFIFQPGADGTIRGMRSDNGAPFRYSVAAVAARGVKGKCPKVAPARLGCNSIIHGIQFAYDSAEIRPESEAILAKLYEGLRAERGRLTIEGYTSSEGQEAYNADLSKRRAEAVVADLVRRGLARDKVSASGRGESNPIASNDDEAGRSMNRRVEVRCSEAP